jgi:hypothetical protein
MLDLENKEILSQWILSLEDGTSVSQENVEKSSMGHWGNFSKVKVINDKVYRVLDVFDRRKIRAISIELSGRMYTLSLKHLSPELRKLVSFYQCYCAVFSKGGKKESTNVLSREIGIITENYIISMRIFLRDGSETTHIEEIRTTGG